LSDIRGAQLTRKAALILMPTNYPARPDWNAMTPALANFVTLLDIGCWAVCGRFVFGGCIAFHNGKTSC